MWKSRIRIRQNDADRTPIVGGGGQWAGGGRTQREPSERPPPAEQVGRHKILFTGATILSKFLNFIVGNRFLIVFMNFDKGSVKEMRQSAGFFK